MKPFLLLSLLLLFCVPGAEVAAIRPATAAAPALVSAPSQSRAKVVYHWNTNRKIIALTFDAGADRGYGARILSTLERYRVRATFGMTGRWAKANPDLIHRMVKDRDTFINHTYDHRPFTPSCATGTLPVLTDRQRTDEVVRAENIIIGISHRSPRPYFRPPCGGLDTRTLQLLPRLGYRYVIMWSVDSLGWNGLGSAAIVHRCLALASPGGIIAMHVGIQSQDAAALPAVINGLRRKGYSLVTVPILIASR